MTNAYDCPICEAGNLLARSEQIEVEYRGETSLRASLYSVCDGCGSEQASAAQLRANKRDTIAFKKSVDGLLTGTEVRALRLRLGINQSQAAAIFGGGPVAFSKYENDDIAQADSMNKLMLIADKFPEVFAELALRAGVELTAGVQVSLLPSATSEKWVNTPPVNHQQQAAERPKPNLRLVHSRDLQAENDVIWQEAL